MKSARSRPLAIWNLRLTLAVVLLFSLCHASAKPVGAATAYGDSQQETPTSKPAAADSKQDEGTPSGQNSTKPKPAAAQAPSHQNQPPAKKPRRKKKALPGDCNSASASATSSAAAGSASSGSAPPDPGTGGIGSPAAGGSTNCPPSKKIVLHGGTSEPNIQLAGGPVGEKASQQRDSANQMLAVTEKNIERIAGRELTASQQDMASQTRQFMEQAKAAIAAEDFDRARTLAWKAQLLSEELANPQK